MHRSTGSRRAPVVGRVGSVGPLAAAVLVIAVLVAACGGSAGPAASASASTSGTASTSSSAVAPSSSSAASSSASAPSSAASGAASPDDVLGVRIAAPYTLADLPASTSDALQAGIQKNLGAYAKAVRVTVKAIQRSGTATAFLMIVAFPRGTLSGDIYRQVITDLSMGAESTFAPKLIQNVAVSFGTLSGGSVAVFRDGDLVLLALSPRTADLTPVATALVAANG